MMLCEHRQRDRKDSPKLPTGFSWSYRTVTSQKGDGAHNQACPAASPTVNQHVAHLDLRVAAQSHFKASWRVAASDHCYLQCPRNTLKTMIESRRSRQLSTDPLPPSFRKLCCLFALEPRDSVEAGAAELLEEFQGPDTDNSAKASALVQSTLGRCDGSVPLQTPSKAQNDLTPTFSAATRAFSI